MAWLGWVISWSPSLNALAVWIGVTFSSYHGKAWLVIGWGAYVSFLVVMLILSVSLLRHRHTAAVARCRVIHGSVRVSGTVRPL